jgi:hypothetical protein
MSYEVTYDTTKPETQRKAVKDVLEYVGTRRFKVLVRAITTNQVNNEDQFAFIASFAGVQGYPVHTMWLRYTSCENHDDLMGHDGYTR